MTQPTILLIALILSVSACSTNYTPAPDWTAAKQGFTEVEDPDELPLLCAMPWTPDRDTVCMRAIAEYEEVAEAIAAIALRALSALSQTEQAYEEAILGGEKQQWVTNQYSEALKEEKTEHFWDNVMRNTIIAIGLLGAALL